ncbi:MAG: hypothetical protein WC214_04330 [Candidatus Omnitrophota bacterium]|jgi:hypothetical protein
MRRKSQPYQKKEYILKKTAINTGHIRFLKFEVSFNVKKNIINGKSKLYGSVSYHPYALLFMKKGNSAVESPERKSIHLFFTK